MKQNIKWAALAAVVILAGGILWFVVQNRQKDNTAAGLSYQLDVNASDWDGSVRTQSDNPTGIKVPGYDTVYFAAGDRQQSITLYNPKENDCYFVFSLSINGGNSLYQSGYVEPGKAISAVTLSDAPEAGNSTLIIHIYTYDVQTEQALNDAVVQCDLIVL